MPDLAYLALMHSGGDANRDPLLSLGGGMADFNGDESPVRGPTYNEFNRTAQVLGQMGNGRSYYSYQDAWGLFNLPDVAFVDDLGNPGEWKGGTFSSRAAAKHSWLDPGTGPGTWIGYLSIGVEYVGGGDSFTQWSSLSCAGEGNGSQTQRSFPEWAASHVSGVCHLPAGGSMVSSATENLDREGFHWAGASTFRDTITRNIGNIFDDIDTATAWNGSVDYRMLYIFHRGRNVDGTPGPSFRNFRFWCDSQPITAQIDIGFDVGQINTEPTPIVDRFTAPAGIDFKDYDSPENSIQIPEVKSLDRIPIWFRRTVFPGQSSIDWPIENKNTYFTADTDIFTLKWDKMY